MKKTFFKFISCLLLLATLLPFAVACADNPPPPQNNGDDTPSAENGGAEGGAHGGDQSGTQGGEQGGTQGGEQTPPESENAKYVTVKQIGASELTLLDVTDTSNTLFGGQPYTNVMNDSKGKASVKWTTSSEGLVVIFPTPKNIGSYYYLEFELYSSSPITLNVGLYFGGNIATSYKNNTITLAGGKWQSVKIRTEEYSVVNPYPDAHGAMLTIDESAAKGVEVYLSSMVATKPTYQLVVPDGIDVNDSSYYANIVKNAATYIVGDGSALDNAAYTKKITSFESDATSAWNLFKSTYKDDATPETANVFDISMSGYDNASHQVEPKCGQNLGLYYGKLEAMAKGYACNGTSTYQSAELLADIKKGLEYGYTYYYGIDILQDGKTYGNWYDWDINIPTGLINVLVLIKDTLTDTEIAKYLAPFDALVSIPQGAAANRMMSGRLVILSGALQKNALKIAVANELLSDIFGYVDEIPENAPIEVRDGGFYTDGSFIQHSGVPYAAVYGLGLIEALSKTLFVSSGTPFEISCEGVEHQYEWIFNAFRTIIYDDSLMVFTSGRMIAVRNMEVQYTTSLLCHTVTMRAYAPNDLKDDFDELNKYLISSVKVINTSWINEIPFPFIKYCLELDANTEITPAPSLMQTFVFGAMDAVVHHGIKYGVAISMSSIRTTKYESINGQNESGWYHSDGMIYIYTDGYDYGFQHFWYADPYIVQGTTVNLAPRKDQNIHPQIYNKYAFAGGVMQGLYGSAGYILGYPDDALALGSNTFYDESCITIEAKKSYFMFDNEIVCLGSGITDESGFDVITTVENRMWGKRNGWQVVEDYLYIDGKIVAENDLVTIDRSYYTDAELENLGSSSAPSDGPSIPETSVLARTMWFSNMGGYVFLRADADGVDKDGNVIRYAKATNNPYSTMGNTTVNKNQFKETQDFLEIVIDHTDAIANDPSGAKYAYVYLPESTVQETENYYANPDVVIIARDLNTHAVIEKTLGIIACNFFADKGGEVNNPLTNASAVTKIKAYDACSVMVTRNADGSYTISVSDPTQLNASVELEIAISGITQVVSTDSNVSASISGGVARITVNTKGVYGSTFNVTVR